MKDQRVRRLAWLIAAALMSCATYAGAEDGLEELTGRTPRVAALGYGTYGIAGTTADFTFAARQIGQRPARGRFRQTLVFQGLLIDFVGKVTCLAVDAEKGRLWVGGIVVKNNSDNPNFQRDIHQPGRDVWFRVLDTGRGATEPDRTTFLGFEGAAGIVTSEEYCQVRPWPGPPEDEPNARTNALTEGNIRVREVPRDDA